MLNVVKKNRASERARANKRDQKQVCDIGYSLDLAPVLLKTLIPVFRDLEIHGMCFI